MNETYQTLISPSQVIPHVSDQEWLIIDCSFYLQDIEKGYNDYLNKHLPNAVYAHLENDLSGNTSPTNGRHPLPKFHNFEILLRNWGFIPGMQVVAYDSAGGSLAAARLWWLMNYFGFPRIAVLDGGFQNWIQYQYPVTSLLSHKDHTSVSISENYDLIVNSQTIRELSGNADIAILDGRAINRFHGMDEIIDPVPGHIPGAINLPVTNFLNEDLTMKPIEIIRAMILEKLHNTPPERAIYYCGSGVTAAFGIFAMAYTGLPPARLYPGSWSEWIKHPWAEIASL